jgi:hypothetical protein
MAASRQVMALVLGWYVPAWQLIAAVAPYRFWNEPAPVVVHGINPVVENVPGAHLDLKTILEADAVAFGPPIALR